VLNLSSTDLELLKRRLRNLITDETVYDVGSICKVHKDKYLKWYQLRQRTCCDPFNKHPNKIRAKSLKSISLNLSMRNPVLIPGKKLCVSCYSSLHSPVSEAESKIPTSEKEIDSDKDYCESTVLIDQLNKSCEALDVSPIKVSKFSSKRKLDYMQSKVKKLCKCVATKASAVIGVDNISNPSKTKDMTCSDCMSMMQKLLNKFTNASLKEKIQILTLVPDSWTIQQTRIYFNSTGYLVKKVRNLKATEGMLSVACDKKGAKLSSETVEKVITFYYNDDNSRICPGKKDCISVASENGRVLKQKRSILYNLKELYVAFKRTI
jgi:hypothetical protein